MVLVQDAYDAQPARDRPTHALEFGVEGEKTMHVNHTKKAKPQKQYKDSPFMMAGQVFEHGKKGHLSTEVSK